MHEPYERKIGHPADFRVKYRFYTPEEGGRKTIPFQGYCSDLWYDNDGPSNQIFMIWPEFEANDRDIILNNNASVPTQGTARMWILLPERRFYHAERIKVGLKCYFMEGGRKVAECEVIEILGLLTNPTDKSH